MIVYCITNKINGKRYVGQTTKCHIARLKQHANEKDCRYLYRAMKLYGLENFTTEIIAVASSIDELNQLEFKYINELSTKSPNGYNIRDGGGSKGKLSEETKKLMSEAHKGSKNSFYGKTHSKETLDKMRRSGTDHYFYGKKHKKETRLKQAKSRNSGTIKVLDRETNQLIGIYISQRECAEALKIARKTIRKYLTTNNNDYKYIFILA